jgi:hypothetical protein
MGEAEGREGEIRKSPLGVTLVTVNKHAETDHSRA